MRMTSPRRLPNASTKYSAFFCAAFSASILPWELEKEGITNYKVEDSLFKTDDVYQDDTISHDNWIEFLSEKFNKKGMG